ncbi:M48 family metallopeptidase [Streptomyces rishiriensis]|uniref:Zn-dependent protease with chaperone function n=1 Tax=Streptomyces rishiriensis TaxID=68264 RepID=A0ABU0NHX5_STRRH|nr:M48 family metallopeptidase [Streptomyces rishiriensis]MDQ0578670.1 Zn-dependent protease with chaperone function [Streptomyces rishiriensis]
MREQMPGATLSRALLGCALLAGVQLLALAVLSAQLLLIIVVLTTRTWQVALLGSLTVISVSTLAYGLLARTSAVGAEGIRIALTPRQQPELWALTLRLADELNTPAPTTLRLADTVNAHAGERSRLLGLVGGARTLDLGLPLLLGLTSDELRAVLCHELGHYARRHTRLAAVSHRGSVALARTVRYLEVLETDQTSLKPPVRLLLKLVSAYNGMYLRHTLAVRRSQELEADAAAAAIAGAHTLAQALRTVHALAPLWDEFTGGRSRPTDPTASKAGKNGSGALRRLMLPDGVFRDFADRITEPVGVPFEDGQGAWEPDTAWEDGGLGSHPPLRVRLAALGCDVDPDSVHRPAVSERAPAAGLLRNLPELAETLQEAMRAVHGAAPERAVSVEPPRLTKAFLRFKIKTTLIGVFLILLASVLVHAVVSPSRSDLPPLPTVPGEPGVWPEASQSPLTIPTFSLPPIPPSDRFTALPLVPVK